MEPDPEFGLVLTRKINAPREILRPCRATPEHPVNLLVPRPHRVINCQSDPSVGGALDTTCDVNGNVVENKGICLEALPNEKLAFTDARTEDWKPAPDPFMTANVTSEDICGGCTHDASVARLRYAEAAKTRRDMGLYGGWGIAATQLEVYTQELK